MLFVLLAAMVVALIATGVRLRRAEAKLETYQREYGILDVENPELLSAVTRWTPEPGQWRWRVHIPPGRHNVFCAVSEIPARGVPKDGAHWEGVSGDVNVSAVVYKDPANGRWKLQVALDGSSIRVNVPVCPMEAKMTETDGIAWNQPPTSASPHQPMILLRQRIGAKQKNGAFSCPDLSNGLMIWIQPVNAPVVASPTVVGPPSK